MLPINFWGKSRRSHPFDPGSSGAEPPEAKSCFPCFSPGGSSQIKHVCLEGKARFPYRISASVLGAAQRILSGEDWRLQTAFGRTGENSSPAVVHKAR